MADDVRLVFVFFQELAGAGEGYLIDVAVYFVRRHAYAVVGDAEGFLFLVKLDFDLQVSHFSIEGACTGERLEFLGCVHCVRHKLAQEDFVVAVEELLDDRENVLGGYSYLSFCVCHNA